MSTTMTIPTNIRTWVAELNAAPARIGWGAWDNVGNSCAEGVQNWATGTTQDGYNVGVWGNVAPVRGGEEDEVEVNWCVYLGDSQDPHRCGFETAKAAQQFAEREFPEAFAA